MESAMFDAWKRRRAAHRYSEAMRLINKSDYARAKSIGEELLRIQFSGGWEVLALVERGQGNMGAALRVLQEGVECVPSVWSLWKLLGDTLSDLKRFDEAFSAYQNAISLGGADEASVRYNWALALARAGKADEALDQLRWTHAGSGPLQWRIPALVASVLGDLRRFDEAIAACSAALAAISDENGEGHAQLLGAKARVLLLKGDSADARAMALEAVSKRFVAEGAWVLREIAPLRSLAAKSWRIIVKGRWPRPVDGETAVGFFRTFELVADEPDEAMTYIRPFEPLQAGDSLKVESIECRGPAADQPKGVYWASGHIFHRRDDDSPVH